MADEQVFFQQGEITVTNARFIAGSETFAMRNISSVREQRVKAKVGDAGALMLVGVAVALVGLSVGVPVTIFGVLLVAGGFYMAWSKNDTFAVVLTTSGGEVTAYESGDRQFISSIVKALNDSIVARG